MFSVYPGSVSDASLWTRPVRGSRGPTPAHSRAAIAAAAIALADADGLGAVSMRGVAAALGTGAGSLYRYLNSRDELLDLMVDAAIGELAPDAPAGDWLDAAVALARRQLALYLRHPWLTGVVQRPSTPGPHALAWFDRFLGVLAPLRCGAAAKFEAIAMVTGVVTLFARSANASGSLSFDGVDDTAYPHLATAFAEPAGPGPRDDLVDRTLRSVLAGLLGATGTAG